MTKNKRDRLAQVAKRRQSEEVAKQLELEVAESMKPPPAARTGVPGRPVQPLTPDMGQYPGAGPGKGQVHSR